MKRGVNNSHDSRRFYDWLSKATEDLLAATLLMEDERTAKQAVFHCQQCIEKGLKGYILLKSGNLVDGHNLTWLCRHAAKMDGEFMQWVDESIVLNRYYIETRYPTDAEFKLSTAAAQKAFQMAKDMYDFLCEQIEDEYHDKLRAMRETPQTGAERANVEKTLEEADAV